jgi:hypothetical protein
MHATHFDGITTTKALIFRILDGNALPTMNTCTQVRVLFHTFLPFAVVTLGASAAYAQTAPPPDATPLVTAPKFAPAEPTAASQVDGTTVTFAAGGMWNTGNSRQLAATANGAFDKRFGDNGIGASLLGNYAQGAAPGENVQVTSQNIQGRLRYDRYVQPNASVFVLETGRHDRLQGIDYRNNADVGFKYLFYKEVTNSLWAEIGYDLQYDIRRNGARTVVDDNGNPILDANGQPTILSKTETDHSVRLFVGFKHGFNQDVTLATGIEYLQSFVESTRNRINYDALFAAQVGGGLSVGLGFSLRYDHDPLPDKKRLDTATTVSLIYSFTDIPKKKEPPTCPCPAPASEPAPADHPAPASDSTQPASSTPPPPADNTVPATGTTRPVEPMDQSPQTPAPAPTP